MAGYTRQSTYTDGDIIQASDSNDEFDQILAAFSASSGHAHDGTSSEGPVIKLIGDAGSATPLNKIEVDTANARLGFYINVSSSSVEQIRLQDGALVPVTNNDVDLGTNSLRFKDAYLSGNLSIAGNTVFSGNLTFGDADTDNVTFVADVNSNILPNTDNAFDLGSATKEWRDLYIDGTANIDSLVADTADINAGTIDGTVIGATAAAAITGTTVTATTGFTGTLTGNVTGNVTGTVSSLSNHTTTNLAEGTNLYYTTARANTDFDTRLATKTTTNLAEGTNLYYTTARFDTAFSGKTTTNLAEGTNLYYTDARFDSRLATKTTTNLAEGTNLYYTTARFDSAFSGKTTTNLAEGTNLYYTSARFDTAFSGKDTDDLSEGVTNLYYTTARANTDFDTRLATKTTSDLTEGTNLYYTDTRANAAIDARVTQTFVNNLNIDAATLGGDSKTTILATAQADALALAIALG